MTPETGAVVLLRLWCLAGATSRTADTAQRGRARGWVGGLRRARYVQRRRTAGSPTGRESQGDGVPV